MNKREKTKVNWAVQSKSLSNWFLKSRTGDRTRILDHPAERIKKDKITSSVK